MASLYNNAWTNLAISSERPEKCVGKIICPAEVLQKGIKNMKTLEELYKDVIASDELKKEFTEAAKSKDDIEALLKKHDCGASFNEFITFLKEKSEGEMDDDEVEAVAGGKSKAKKINDTVISVITNLAACLYIIIPSVGPEEKLSFDECTTRLIVGAD